VRVVCHYSTIYNNYHIIPQCTEKYVTPQHWIFQKKVNCLLQQRSNNHCVCSLLWIMIHLWQNIYFDYLWHFKGWWWSSKKHWVPLLSPQTRSLWTPSSSQFAALCRPWHKEKESEGASSASLSLILQVKSRIVQFQSFRILSVWLQFQKHAISKNYT
jgi:hypothetical protein